MGFHENGGNADRHGGTRQDRHEFALAAAHRPLPARLLDGMNDPAAALRAYEDERLKVTSEIVLTNRDQPPDYIIQIVENLTGGEPFDRIEDIIDPTELAAISDHYKDIAGYSLESVE